MIQLDAQTTTVFQLFLVMLVTVVASAATGLITESRWRSKAKTDLEICLLLEKTAKSENDYLALETLRRSAVKNVIRSSARGGGVDAALSILAFAVAIVIVLMSMYVMFVIGREYPGHGAAIAAFEVFGCAVVALQVSLLVRHARNGFALNDHENRHAEGGRDSAEHDEPERENHDCDD